MPKICILDASTLGEVDLSVFEKFGVIPVGRYEQSYFSDSSKCPNCAYGERVKLDHLVKVTLFRTVTEGIQCPMMIVQAGDTIPKGWITGWVKRVDK
jgi:hypothetical protein